MKKNIKRLVATALVMMLSLGSVSSVYAENPKSCAIFGDADKNGKVNISDATYVQKFVAKIIDLDREAQLLSDVNEDSVVNIKDTTDIQKWLAKIITNDKIGVPLEEETEASATATGSAETSEVTTVPETTHQTDPIESETAATATVPHTTATPDLPEATEVTTEIPASSSSETDPAEVTTIAPTEETTEETTAETPTEIPEDMEVTTVPDVTEDKDATPDSYRKEVMDKFAQMGHNPYEDGMFYQVIYYYYSTPDAPKSSPEYLLIWASIGAVADESFEITLGDYALMCPGHCYPYSPGYYIYRPSTDTLMTIRDAYNNNLKGLKTVFKEAPVFRPLSVDFRIVMKERINSYGSEDTLLYLLHHSSAEEQVTSKFTTGWFDVPELNLPKDENGFYTNDKVYLASFNVVGGGNAHQNIDRIIIENGILTVYRSIMVPELATPDMYYEFVLIELDAKLAESVTYLWDITEHW